MSKDIIRLVIKALETQHAKVMHRYCELSEQDQMTSYDGILLQKLDIAIECVYDLLEE